LTTAKSSIYAESTNQNINISYKRNLLSIWTKDADLKKVLFELADKTNIYVELPVSLKKTITINKSGISLSEALRDILKNLNYVIFYSGIKNKNPLITNVFVYSESKKSRKLTGRVKPPASSEIQSANKIKGYERNIKTLERRIESTKKKLSEIDKSSRQGKKYSRRIKQLEKLIKTLKAKSN
jgi:predicted RNase H-like nuclease (RuvC/YqgF family)